jgi:cytochrome c biogenesis protein CcmG/thiol:disulfide interchange protein DsbE
LTDLGGSKLQLSSLKGQAVVVNFWATWCEPCKIEMPWLVDLQKKYGPQGLQILGVAMDDAEDQAIRDFAKKMGVNYPVLKGTEALADLYGGLEGLPATFFVDRSGKISDEAMGLMSQSLIEDSIKHALGPAPTGEKQP